MAEPDETMHAGDADQAPPLEMKPIPPEMYKGPGGCGFTGCMWIIMVFAALALAFLVIGLLTREWMVPVAAPR